MQDLTVMPLFALAISVSKKIFRTKFNLKTWSIPPETKATQHNNLREFNTIGKSITNI
jgi:hypothetical protein